MVFIVSEPENVVNVDELSACNSYYYKHCQLIRDLYNERFYDGCNQNLIVDQITESYMYDETVQSAVIGLAKVLTRLSFLKDTKKENKYTNYWFITLTSKDEWNETDAKQKIDKFRESHFKKYKYIYCEEHGTNSEKYHQHVLVYNTGRFHTGINLKSTKYYDANINIQRVSNKPNSLKNIIEYMKKENDIKGDLQFFSSI